MRPTRDGWVLGALLLALTAISLYVGNNLLLMLVAAAWAWVVIGVPLAAWNLRGVHVARVLPAEIYARTEAPGRYLVRNDRRWLPALAVQITEGHTQHTVDIVGPGEGITVPASWRFDGRGHARLDRVLLTSTWPYGLFEVRQEVSLPAQLVVYPKPRTATSDSRSGAWGARAPESGKPGRLGDFEGLRPYRPGDAPRSVHWPTSARTGTVMVVQRSAEGGEQIIVEVADHVGDAWEHELGMACDAIQRAFARGAQVGLAMPGEPLMSPRPDPYWRRELLAVLALVSPR